MHGILINKLEEIGIDGDFDVWMHNLQSNEQLLMISPGSSGWIIGVWVGWYMVIHPLLRGVASPSGRQPELLLGRRDLLVSCPVPTGRQWMDYKCWLSSLGNSSTTSGSSDPGGTEGPSYSLTVGTSFYFMPAALLSYFTLLIYFLCFFVLFYCCRSHAQVFGKEVTIRSYHAQVFGKEVTIRSYHAQVFP